MSSITHRAVWLSLVAVLAPGGCTGAIDSSNEIPPDESIGGNGGGAGGSGSDPIINPPKINNTPACTGTPSVAPTPLRRLTRDEYANAAREVLGEALGATRPAIDTLAEDELVGPFFGNSVQRADESLTQNYMDTAERIGASIAVAAKLDALVGPLQCAARDEACAGKFVDKYGPRAYRRPLTADERTRYLTLYRAYAASSGGFTGGVRGIVQTLLQSPNFVYHLEVPEAAAVGGLALVGGYALASRLSFLLWNSGPDDVLLAAAGGLSDPKNVRTQVSRMLADGRAREGLAAFHLQWIGIEGRESIREIAKNTAIYAKFTLPLRAAMRSETVSFVDHVMRGGGDGRLSTLLTAPFSFLDASMAALYGVTGPPGTSFVKTDLDPRQRGGLLTQASMLTVHAQTDGSSPVKRGVVIRKNLLCQEIPDPPPGVNNAPPLASRTLTTRERYVQVHEKDPTCASCHKLIDHIGFAFENYDGIGGWRTTENNKPVVASVDLTGTDIDGKYANAIELDGKLAQSNLVKECTARQWFRYSFGRSDTMADACTIQQMVATLEASQLDLRAMLGALATSDAFRYQKVQP